MPFATIWLQPDSENRTEEIIQRLPNRKIPRPRPTAGDPRLQMLPATQISPKSWLAMTGKPHPEPGDGVAFDKNRASSDPASSTLAPAEQNAAAGSGAADRHNSAKRKSTWSFLVAAQADLINRKTNGELFFQRGFSQPSAPYLSGKICGERSSNSKWSMCLERNFSILGTKQSYESTYQFEVGWQQRYEVLANHALGLSLGFYRRNYSPPGDDPLNTESTAKGLMGRIGNRIAESSSWYEPELNFAYFYALKGQDVGDTRGERISQTGYRFEIKNRIASSKIWSSGAYDMAFRVYSSLSLTNWQEVAVGKPRNPLFPSGTAFDLRELAAGVSVALEEVTW